MSSHRNGSRQQHRCSICLASAPFDISCRFWLNNKQVCPRATGRCGWTSRELSRSIPNTVFTKKKKMKWNIKPKPSSISKANTYFHIWKRAAHQGATGYLGFNFSHLFRFMKVKPGLHGHKSSWDQRNQTWFKSCGFRVWNVHAGAQHYGVKSTLGRHIMSFIKSVIAAVYSAGRRDEDAAVWCCACILLSK